MNWPSAADELKISVMKTLTIELPDDVYERAERRAAEIGTTLSREVTETVTRLGTNTSAGIGATASTTEPPNAAAIARLLAASDKARNTESVGGLKRDELYDELPENVPLEGRAGDSSAFPILADAQWPVDVPLSRDEMYDDDGR